MKRISTLSLILFFSQYLLFAGNVQPPADVPRSIRFADLNVRFDESARKIISQDITSLVQSNKKYWEAKLDRVVLYFPLIETILQEEGVPVDLKYLAVQESSLTPDAVSSSTAVGYWQFKKETATDHGMRVDDEVDERKSIVASTRGAARYFKRNNAVYNNWVSSLFSYYLGTTGISKLVPAEWSYAREITLNDKTDRYILRFFAHKIAFESVLPDYRTTNSVALVEYPYGSGKSVSKVASDLKISETEIRKYNRWILSNSIPADKEYVLAIPATNEQMVAIRQQLQAISRTQVPEKKPDYVKKDTDTGFPILRKVNYSKGKSDVVLYEINGLPGIQALAGDNVTTLARKARISVSSFLRYNDMSSRDPIKEGDVYYLAKKMRKAVVPHHTVSEGETVLSISHMYGIRLKKLLSYNRLDRSDRLQLGRVMWLRERRPKKRPVEIIKTPATPAPASTPVASQPTTGTSESRISQSSGADRTANKIPKNASERKMYSPKLVETKESPAPSASTGTNSRTTATTSAPTSSPVENPVTAAPQPAVEAPITESAPVTMSNAGSTQRVIIVRPEGSTSTEPDTEATSIRTTTPAPISRPAESKPVAVEPSLTYTPAQRPTSEPASKITVARPASTPAPTTARTGSSTRSLTHKVEPGQTYYSISRIYNVSVDDLLQWNKLTQNDKLAVGKLLVIKTDDEVSKSLPTSSGNVSTDPLVTEEILYHTVQKGETMFRISKQYGVTVEQIQTWNHLSNGGVSVGQQLKIIKK